MSGQWPAAARLVVAFGAFNLLLAVALGAAGAHALKAQLALYDGGAWFDVARRYQELHALGLIAIGLAIALRPTSRLFLVAAVAIAAGIVLFSGSLYLRSLVGLDAVRALTPAGGVAFMIGWLLFGLGALTGWRRR